MSEPISTPPTENYFTPPAPAKAEGEPQAAPIGTEHTDANGVKSGIAWTRRAIPAPGTEMTCSICSSLKPWHLYNRKTGKGMCSPCFVAGYRFSADEG